MRRTGRAAAVLLLVLGICLRAGAQSPILGQPSLNSTSTLSGVPFSWPTFHSGGAPGPYSAPPAGTLLEAPFPYTLQLQGTPSEYLSQLTGTSLIYQTSVQIPSYQLGNYDPTQPPSGLVSGQVGQGTFFPNHFRDNQVFSWSAPYAFADAPASQNAAVLQYVDDSDGPPNFNLTGTWSLQNSSSVAGTATNGEYQRALVSGSAAVTATASWTLNPPVTGPYVLTYHIPDMPTDGTEERLAKAEYTITYHDINDVLQSAVVHVSQTGSNGAQVLGGPFLFRGTDKYATDTAITIVLDNSGVGNPDAAKTFVIADSVALRPGTGLNDGLLNAQSDVRAAPVAVNDTQYPEIEYAYYFGTLAATLSQPDPVAHGTPAGTATPNTTSSAIRQLVYFSRSEIVPHYTLVSGVLTPDGTLSTVGAVYCVDGFTGSVVWRYETPATYTPDPTNPTTGTGRVQKDTSHPVYSTPAVARINVLVGGTAAAPLYATKLVVIFGDDSGKVYCLDALGNQDGTSNSNAIDTRTGQPNFYDLTVAHVGTTFPYWVYRPDPSLPKYVAPLTPTETGKNIGDVKAVGDGDPKRDLPVPAAFSLASASVYVDPTVATKADSTIPAASGGKTYSAATLPANATVLIGNSNGVLYALDATGIPVPDSTTATLYLNVQDDTIAATATAGKTVPITGLVQQYGDIYNASLDIRPTVTSPIVPTCEPRWWFSIRGVIGDPNNTSNASIQGAPAIFFPPRLNPSGGTNPLISAGTGPRDNDPVVYVGSSHEQEADSNVGRLYALDGRFGPAGSSGKADPTVLTTDNSNTGPGSVDYNVDPRPQLPLSANGGSADTAHWSFPDAYQINSVTKQPNPRPALGNISGSPVVFTNPYEPSAKKTRIYIAANVGVEVPAGSAAGTAASARPADDETGRVWAVNLDGSTAWAYPSANDPNDATKDTVAEPSAPIGAFLHATPALGVVEFPAVILNGDGTNYTHQDAVNTTNVSNTGGAGAFVPMLYVGTQGQNDNGLYALDLNPPLTSNTTATQNDQNRAVFRLESPTGAAFQSSPVLVTDPLPPTGSAVLPGNGGAVFVTAGNTLLQVNATPLTNLNAGQAFAFVSVDARLIGFGPISSPAVAAGEIQGTIGGSTIDSITNWVYVGDTGSGLCRGVTPFATGTSGVNGFLQNFAPTDVFPPAVINGNNPPYNLHTYLFQDSTSSSTVTNGTQGPFPSGPGSKLPVYEWGETAYIRISGVVPPNPGDTDPTLRVADTDSAGNSIYYTNGSPVTFQIAEVTSDGRSINPDSGYIPAYVVGTAAAGVTGLPANGFTRRPSSDVREGGTTPDVVPADAETAPNGARLWIAAYSYAIGDGSGRRNTPGARRRLINAFQTAEIHDAATGNLRGTLVLQATSTQGYQYVGQGANGKPVIKQTAALDQPTFGILNPLAVRGGAIPLSLNGQPASATPLSGYDLGPFGAISDRTAPTLYDLRSYNNGNSVFLQSPVSGSGTGTINPTDPSGPNGRLNSTDYNPPQQYELVATGTGEIDHGTTGSNADPDQGHTLPPVCHPPAGATDNGVGPNAGYGFYSLNVADRSAIGVSGFYGLRVGASRATARWNDNTTTGGPGAAVNPLPWDDVPTSIGAGRNYSLDYPDIRSGSVTQTLIPSPYGDTGITGGPLVGQAQYISRALASGGNPAQRQVLLNPIEVSVDVPRYQPANLQLWNRVPDSSGAVSPNIGAPLAQLTSINTANDNFAMGYVVRERIFVDSDGTGTYSRGEAYRDVQVFVGVPVDMSTDIAEPTLDVGSEPHGFGIQTSQYTGLEDPTSLQFTPYNSKFQNFYRPVTVHNDGNVNLLNVQFDQLLFNPQSGASGTLSLQADPLDPLSTIPAFDGGGITGPRAAALTGTGVAELPYLVRTSLDSDLVQAYGRNPGIVAGYAGLFQGATLHKARSGDTQPTVMFVPDTPHDNQPNDPRTAAYFLEHSPNDLPSLAPDPNAAGRQFSAKPYVGVAVPLGTPLGNYQQKVRVFEGFDVTGNPPIGGGLGGGPVLNPNGEYSPILGPYYGGAPGGQATPTGNFTKAFAISNGISQQAYSDPSPILSVNVIEARITDGFSFGDLPQIDDPTGVTGYQPTADFLPTAFRNFYWQGDTLKGGGNLDLYWTASRGYTGTQLPPYNILAATLPFQLGSSTPAYFTPANATSSWWSLGGYAFSNTNNAPVYSNMSAVQNQALYEIPFLGSSDQFDSDGAVYGFVTRVDAASTASPYANHLLCYTLNPLTGAASGAGSEVSGDFAQTKTNPRGLKFSPLLTFSDPILPGVSIQRDLWAFWTAGTRGRNALYYGSTSTAAATGAAGLTWSPSAVLPIPAGLVSVSDASAILLNGVPDAAGANGDPNGGLVPAVPAIEVTYSGIGSDGNADIYVSRYRPYLPAAPGGGAPMNGNTIDYTQTRLALMPYPTATEVLQAGGSYWQARDVAWLRSDTPAANGSYKGLFNVLVNNVPLLRPVPAAASAGTPVQPTNLYGGIKESYDRASGQWIFSGINLNGGGGGNVLLYVDAARGRIRFSQILPAGTAVSATFNSLARRITTNPLPDRTPTSLIDETFKENEAGFNNAANAANGYGALPRVQTARRWYLWQRAYDTATTHGAGLWSKTQRLTVYLHDASNNPLSIKLDQDTSVTPPVNTLKPIVNVTDVLTGATLYSESAGGAVDVDWARGRLYFPLTVPLSSGGAGGTQTYAMEGRPVQVSFSYVAGGTVQTATVTDTVRWVDEPSYNDTTNLPSGDGIGESTEQIVPLNTIVNEGNVSAFLDPMAYANVYRGTFNGVSGTAPARGLDQPHKLWLFWTSTRNGTGDIYYATINPRFTPIVGGSQ